MKKDKEGKENVKAFDVDATTVTKAKKKKIKTGDKEVKTK